MRNKCVYYDTPNFAVCVNFKVGSSSLARAIIKKFQPETEDMLKTKPGEGKGTAYPKNKNVENTRLHSLVKKCNEDSQKTKLLLVRDPIEKFISACVEDRIENIDEFLDWVEENPEMGRRNHFLKQSRFVKNTKILAYKFPKHLGELAKKIGLENPLPDIDGGNSNLEKPVLTDVQKERVLLAYSEDVELFKSIKKPGTKIL